MEIAELRRLVREVTRLRIKKMLSHAYIFCTHKKPIKLRRLHTKARSFSPMKFVSGVRTSDGARWNRSTMREVRAGQKAGIFCQWVQDEECLPPYCCLLPLCLADVPNTHLHLPICQVFTTNYLLESSTTTPTPLPPSSQPQLTYLT